MIDVDESTITSHESRDHFDALDLGVFDEMNNPPSLSRIHSLEQLGTPSSTISVFSLAEADYFPSYSENAQNTHEQQTHNHYMALVQRFSGGEGYFTRIKFEAPQIRLLMERFSNAQYNNLKIINEHESFIVDKLGLDSQDVFELVFSPHFSVNFSLIHQSLDVFIQWFSIEQRMSLLASPSFFLNIKIFSAHYLDTSLASLKKSKVLFNFLLSPTVPGNQRLFMYEASYFDGISSELRAVLSMSPNLTKNWYALKRSGLALKSSEPQLQALLSSDHVVENLNILEQHIPFFQSKIEHHLDTLFYPKPFIDTLLPVLTRRHDLNEKLTYLTQYFPDLIKEEPSAEFFRVLNKALLVYCGLKLQSFSMRFGYAFSHQSLWALHGAHDCGLVLLFIENAMAKRNRIVDTSKAFIKKFKAYYSLDKVFELLTQPLTEETRTFLEVRVFPPLSNATSLFKVKPLPEPKRFVGERRSLRLFEQQKTLHPDNDLQNSSTTSSATQNGFF